MTAEAGDPAETSEQGEGAHRARFEKALRLYAQIGLAPQRTVRQLLRAGFAPDWIRPHFPTLPDQAFELPPSASPDPTQDRRTPRVPPSAETIASGVLARLTPARTSASTPPPTTTPHLLTASARESAPRERIAEVLRDGVSFQYVPLIQCSFPHADPGDRAQFTRRNGWLELTLTTARADTGLPYGVPARLLTIYCASEAVRTRSPEIYLGESVHEFLRRLDVPITRGERGSLRMYANQLLRLIHCAITIDENVRDASGRAGLHIRQALFIEEARLWWDERDGVGQGSSLVLSPVLFDSILERSAPLSTRAMKQLRKSPMDLDVYAWLVHRLFQLGRPSTVTWSQLSGQFGHGYALLRKFRAYFADSLKRVLAVYPEANVKLSDAGVTLHPSKPHIPRDALVTRG